MVCTDHDYYKYLLPSNIHCNQNDKVSNLQTLNYDNNLLTKISYLYFAQVHLFFINTCHDIIDVKPGSMQHTMYHQTIRQKTIIVQITFLNYHHLLLWIHICMKKFFHDCTKINENHKKLPCKDLCYTVDHWMSEAWPSGK